jgi:2-polyprenyl-3-methyl-5-hydroxy-6-metoxy-1,4-benzoquinol methylase
MPRIMADEIMDDPAQSQGDFAAALDGLSTLNRITFAHFPLLQFLDRLVTKQGVTRLSLLDVGAGGGDALRAIAAWGAKREVELDLWGLDRSPWAKSYAIDRGVPASWITADLFDLPVERRFDVVVCNLFAHHLDDPTMVKFLRWLPRHAVRNWLILDLHRHWITWSAVWAGTRLMRMHPMVIHDGPISVNRAFKREELQRLVAEAGVDAEIRWVLPFRWAVFGPGA